MLEIMAGADVPLAPLLEVLIFGVRNTNFYKVFKNFNSRKLKFIPWPRMIRFFKSQSKVQNEYFLLHVFLYIGLCNNCLQFIQFFLWRDLELWRVEFLVKKRWIFETIKRLMLLNFPQVILFKKIDLLFDAWFLHFLQYANLYYFS